MPFFKICDYVNSKYLMTWRLRVRKIGALYWR